MLGMKDHIIVKLKMCSILCGCPNSFGDVWKAEAAQPSCDNWTLIFSSARQSTPDTGKSRHMPVM